MAIINSYNQSIVNDEESFNFTKKYNCTIEVSNTKHYTEDSVEPVINIKLPLSRYKKLMYSKNLFNEIESHMDDPVILDFLNKIQMYMNLKY